jgi:hypothetical protein
MVAIAEPRTKQGKVQVVSQPGNTSVLGWRQISSALDRKIIYKI